MGYETEIDQAIQTLKKLGWEVMQFGDCFHLVMDNNRQTVEEKHVYNNRDLMTFARMLSIEKGVI